MLALSLIASVLAAAGPKFTDVAESSGIDPMHSAGPYSLAAGIAVLDWDEDGYLDLFLAQELSPNTLLRSLGPPTWGFEDVSEEAGIAELSLGTQGVVAADFTGDGRDDLLLLSTEADMGITLLVGRPDHRYVDETPLRVTAPRSAWTSAAYGDPDGDGDLDVVLMRWSWHDMPSHTTDCLASHWFENKDGVLTWRQQGLPSIGGCGIAGIFTDFDDDGDVDYVQANDFGPFYVPNGAYRNDGVGDDGAWRFSDDVGAEVGLRTPVYGMGLAVGDVDGDLRRDLFVGSMAEDALLRGLPGGGYEDVTDLWRAGSILGVDGRRLKWGAAFVDVDNDGDQDLVAECSGFDSDLDTSVGPEPSVLLENRGAPPFADVSLDAGLATTSADRSVVAADLDRDGRVDLAVAGVDVMHLFRNVTEPAGHWLEVRLVGAVSNRPGIGAAIVATSCGRSQVRELSGGGGPGGMAFPEVHFGFGACDGLVSVTVRWPSGYVQTATSEVDRPILVAEPNWLTVSSAAVPADGQAKVTVECTPSPAGVVTWATSAGALDAPQMADLGNGTWRGVLTAPGSPAEAVIGFKVGGKTLPVHRRVRFDGPEPAAWAVTPAVALRDAPARVGVRLGTSGQAGLQVQGGTLSGAVKASGDAAWATLVPAEEALVLQATRDGTPYGAPLTVPVTGRVAPAVSRLNLRLANSGEGPPLGPGFLVFIMPLEQNGWFAPEGKGDLALLPKLLRDGAGFGSQMYMNDHGVFATFVPQAELLPGVYTATAGGVTIGQTAVIRAEAPTAADVAKDKSTFVFLDRHLHADGEDAVPLFILLADAQGQSLGKLGMPPLGIDCDGCTVMPETAHEYRLRRYHATLVRVRVGTRLGPVTATLSFGGQPTGLSDTVEAVPPSPYPPDVSKTLIEFADMAPADGATVVHVSVTPRLASETYAGSGLGLALHSTGGVVAPLTYLGYGLYDAAVTAPAAPCTATLTVTSALAPGSAAASLQFTGPGGEVADTPCTDSPLPDVAPVLEAEPAGAEAPVAEDSFTTCAAGSRPSLTPWLAALLLLAATRSRRSFRT